MSRAKREAFFGECHQFVPRKGDLALDHAVDPQLPVAGGHDRRCQSRVDPVEGLVGGEVRRLAGDALRGTGGVWERVGGIDQVSYASASSGVKPSCSALPSPSAQPSAIGRPA